MFENQFLFKIDADVTFHQMFCRKKNSWGKNEWMQIMFIYIFAGKKICFSFKAKIKGDENKGKKIMTCF